jgi:hypothetical protein
MLLVLLLGREHLETPGIAILESLFLEQDSRQRRITTKERDYKKAVTGGSFVPSF